jgi:hypothetical protein
VVKVATRIPILSTDRPVVEDDGSLTSQSRTFFRSIWVQSLIIGAGSPEGVVEAEIGASYMDNTGSAGSILYIKRDADDGAGDKSIGWILT